MIYEVHQPPAPGTEEWRKIISASKISAMVTDKETGEYLGLGYLTAWEMWQQMMGRWEQPITEEKQAMFDDAHDAEDYACNVWVRRNAGWKIGKGEVAFTDDALPFPNIVTLDRLATKGRKGSKNYRQRIIEVKRPRVPRGVQDGWLCQVQFQMGVTGIHEASLVEVPVYGTPVIHEIGFDQELFDSLVQDAAAFYALVEAGTPPEAGDSEHAKEIFAAQNPVDESAPPAEVNDFTMNALLKAWDALDKATSAATFWENKVAEAMGNSSKALFDKRVVASRKQGRFAQKRLPAEHKDVLKDEKFMSLKFDAAKLKKAMPEVHAAACGEAMFEFNRKEWKER